MKGYDKAPKVLGYVRIDLKEMMFYQDMLIKFPHQLQFTYESRLNPVGQIISRAVMDFISSFGIDRYMESHVYVSVKRLFRPAGGSFNRPGYHADGFMSEDINYIWYDSYPTIFNLSDFDLDQDDTLSMKQMEEQAKPEIEKTYPIRTLLRLDEKVIHKVNVNPNNPPGIRTFVKVTISKDRFDLEGNTINPLIDYDWEMRPRSLTRNIPQDVNKK